MVKKLDILFIFNSLGTSGGDRIGVNIANYLSKYYNIYIYNINNECNIFSLLNDNIIMCNFNDINNKCFDIEICCSEFEPLNYLLSRKNNSKKICLIQTTYFINYDANKHNYFNKKLQKLDKIIFVSNYQYYQFLECGYIINNNKIFINTNKLDNNYINLLSNDKINIKLNDFNICYVGRFDRRKNIFEVLEIVSKIDKKYKLLLIGENKNNDDSVLCKIHDLKLEQYVEIIPFDINPYKYMSKCDIIISASQSESFGLTMLEGILLNKIVMTNKQGAKMEVLENGKYGIIYENVDDAVNIINSIINNKYDLNYLKNNLKEFNNNYDYNTMLINFKNIIETIKGE